MLYIVGSKTKISGCQDPLETDSSRTRNIFSRRMNPSPIFHGVDPHDPCCDSVLSKTIRAIWPRHELTAIESKYCLSFLATWYASSPRVIGSRPLFQRVVEIFCRSQRMVIQPG